MQTETIIDNPEAVDGNALTPDKLRSFPGLEATTDEQAAKIIADLRELSRILYEINAIPKNIIH